MWEGRPGAARGQASLALVGVLVIVCAATYTAYLGVQEHERARGVLALAERQDHLVTALSSAEAGQPRRGLVAAADANLVAMGALAGDDLADNQALLDRLTAVQEAWAIHRANVTGGTAALSVEASRQYMGEALAAFQADFAERLQEEVQSSAISELLILAAAAPLLAWAVLAVANSPVPASAQQAEAVSHQTRRAAVAALLAAEGGQTGGGRRLSADGPCDLWPDRRSGAYHLNGAKLADELRIYASDFKQVAGIAVELSLDERAAESLPPLARAQALTIAREAMSGARRYGQATSVRVALWSEAGSVWLSVVDDGGALQEQAPACERQVGLAILRARAERIGGELRVSAPRNAQTVITARLPVLGRGAEVADEFGAAAVGAPRRAW